MPRRRAGRVLSASALSVRPADASRLVGWQSRALGLAARFGPLAAVLQLKRQWGRRVRLVPPDGLDDGLHRRVEAELARLGDHGEIVGRTLALWDVTGEAWLVGRPDGSGGERWDVVAQVVAEGNRVRVGGQVLPAPVELVRMWVPDLADPQLATSPVQAAMGDIEDLLLLSELIRASAQSQLTAGLLLVPEEAQYFSSDAGEPSFEEWAAELARRLGETVRDPGSPERLVPLVFAAPVDLIDKWRHIQLARPFDEQAARLREEKLRLLAISLDLPVEMLLGLGSGHVNHWSANVIDEQTYRSHVAPSLARVAWALTEGWLWQDPELREARVQIAWDASELLARPQTSAGDVLAALDRGVLDQQEARLLLFAGALPDQPEEDDADRLVGADRSARRSDVGAQLARVDRALFDRLLVAVDDAVDQALSIAGARMSRLVGRGEHRPLLQSVRDVRRIPGVLGPDRWAQLGVTEESLVPDWVKLRAQWDPQVRAAQHRARRLLHLDEEDEELTETQAQDAEAGWLLLAGLLTALLVSLLRDPRQMDVPRRGEQVTRLVPAAHVRAALARAGGWVGQSVRDVTGRVAGLVATGPTVIGAAERAGWIITSWVWQHGDPIIPFPPHEDLDGVQFASWDDDVLANPASWPPVPFFHPGDHDGCTCVAVPVLRGPDE